MLHAALTLQEFADLVDYLASLKQPANSLTANRGMPDEIPLLAKPAALRPLLPESQRFPHSVVKQPGDVRLGLTWFGQVPGEAGAFLAAHQSGKIWRLERGASGFTKTLTLFHGIRLLTDMVELAGSSVVAINCDPPERFTRPSPWDPLITRL